MARLAALCAAVVRVCAAEAAFGAISDADCPSGTAFAWVSQSFPAASIDGWTTVCAPGLDTCLSGGGGKAVTLTGGGGPDGHSSYAHSPTRWRSAVDVAVTWSTAPNAQIGLSLGSMTGLVTSDSKYTQIGVGNIMDAHTIAPVVTLRKLVGTGVFFDPEKDAQVSGRATKASGPGYVDPTGPDLLSSTAVNWTVSLRPESLHIGFNGFYDALVLKKNNASAPWVDPAEELVCQGAVCARLTRQMAELGGRLIPRRDGGPSSGPAATINQVVISGCQVGAVRPAPKIIDPPVSSDLHLSSSSPSPISSPVPSSIGIPRPAPSPPPLLSPQPVHGKKVVVIGGPDVAASRPRVAAVAVLLSLLSITV